MNNITMGDLTDRRDAPVELDKVETVRAVQAYMIQTLGPSEMLKRDTIPADLVDILCDTELPEKFNITGIGSVTNDIVASKYEILYDTPGLLEADMIPGYMTLKYPLILEKEVIEKAPWVNDIHAWMKVLNYSNTLAAIQRGDTEEKDIPRVIASIAEKLYEFTTESEGKPFSTRTSEQFKNQEKFTETIMREAGTKGVNILRHVSMAEMKYILGVMKKAFAK